MAHPDRYRTTPESRSTRGGRRRVAPRLVPLAVALGLVLLVATASAHAYLTASTPANGEVLASPPTELRLELSEAVEVAFSVFKVYPLEVAADAEPADLLRAAKATMETALPLRDDAAARVDTGASADGRRSASIAIGLEPELPPGAYVAMWRVLSIDTHTSEDFLVFIVAPPETP